MSCLVRMGIGPQAGKEVRVPHPVGVNLIARGDATDASQAGLQVKPKRRRRRKAKG